MRPFVRLAALTSSVLLLATCVQLETAPAPADEEMSRARLIAANTAVLDGSVTVMRFDPPPIYTLWRSEVEQCSGITRDGSPTYWVGSRPILNAKGALGFYVQGARRIVLGLGNESIAWIVRHEQLHDNLNLPLNTADTHPPEFFRVKCRHLVFP